jgi:hypothetical protein
VSTLALALVIVGAIVVLGSTAVVRGTLLDEATYRAAFDDVDAFERVYTEVLADPELADVVLELVGGTEARQATATQARALATNSLRLAVPPSTLRQGFDTSLSAVLAYVRGDVDVLVVEVDVGDVVERVRTVSRVQVGSVLAEVGSGPSPESIDRYRSAIEEFVASLEAGTVPESVPKLGGATFDPAEVLEVILTTVGDRVDEGLARRIEAALLAGEEREALVAVAGVIVVERASEAAGRLREGLDDGTHLDLVAQLEARAVEGVGAAAESLSAARSMARWFTPATAMLAGLVALVAAVALGWLNRSRPHRIAYSFAAAAIIGGATTALVWSRVAGSVSEPFGRATGEGVDPWAMPAGVSSVLADVRTELSGSLSSSVGWHVTTWIVVGLLIGVGMFALTHLPDRVSHLTGRAALLVSGLVPSVALVSLMSWDLLRAEAAPRTCNGHVELCDRPYDEVVQAATHNSMSSPDVVEVWPEHDGDIATQLDAGVRALLIDTHYWTPLGSAQMLLERAPDLPPAVVETVYERAGPLADGRDGTFLCHNHCVFGGMPFVDALVDIRVFLERNPGEVVTLIVQDAITPEDTAREMELAGLSPYLYVPDPGGGWPTLAEMVDAGTRLVVFAEEAGPPPPWYANAFEAMQETPFLALAPDQLSCRPNRGDPEATLFLMNHWVQRIAPDRVDSTIINERSFIVDRARECAAERGQLPNFIAVNFFNIGDLMGAVDELNGV